jgi:hypothetical protein
MWRIFASATPLRGKHLIDRWKSESSIMGCCIILDIKGGTMRYPKFVFMLLAVTATLFAADPFVGTWKLNPAKSKYKTGSAPKDQTLTISESGGDLDIAVKGTTSDGKPLTNHYTIPATGGTGKVIESAYEGISGKRPNANERETSYSKAGKVVYTTHAQVSKDGKSLTVHAKGVSPAGQMVDASVSYDKQ